MKAFYSHCSTCQALQDCLAATGREYSATLQALFDARGFERYAHAANVADGAYFRFCEAKRDLERHRDFGKHDNPGAGGAGS